MYGFDSGECVSIWSQSVGESVRSVAVGEVLLACVRACCVFGLMSLLAVGALAQVCTAGFKEVVFATYSGRIGSYTTEAMEARDADDAFGRSKQAVVRETQIARLR